MWWKLLADWELFWVNLQLGEFQFSASLVTAFLPLGIVCLMIGYLALKAATWQNRAERAEQGPGTVIVVSPAPSVWPRAIAVIFATLSAAMILYLW